MIQGLETEDTILQKMIRKVIFGKLLTAFPEKLSYELAWKLVWDMIINATKHKLGLTFSKLRLEPH